MKKVKKGKTFISAVVLCAGNSERMGAAIDKQFHLLSGRSVAHWAISAFENSPLIDEIVVVAKKEAIARMENLVAQGGFQKVTQIIAGGETRTTSSRFGVEATSQATEFVLIHDGARPFVDELTIMGVVQACLEYGAAAPGIPVRETIKVVGDDWTILGTPNRETMVTIQTPQGFSKGLYLEATSLVEKSQLLFDDCQLVEQAGGRVKITKGDPYNLKITTPEDIPLAEAIYHVKEGAGLQCASDTDMTSIGWRWKEN